MLKLGFHGGKCCGMKVIFGFPEHPKDQEIEIVPVTNIWGYAKPNDSDSYGYDVKSDVPFFNAEAPMEGAIERLKRYIAYCDEHRPHGIIECVLRDSASDDNVDNDDQNKVWGSILEQHGFKLVNKCLNSNSCNYIYVYHRNH